MEHRINKLTAKRGENEGVLITGKPNIFYYSGFTSEDAYLYISRNSRVIITDSRYTIQAKKQAPGFELFSEKATELLKKVEEKRIWIEDGYLTVSGFNRLSEECTDIEFIPNQKEISDIRYVKDEYEIKKIAEAEALGDAAFEYISGRIKSGMTENEIAMDIEFFMRKNGASGLSFETICASGVRSAMPHGTASEKVIEKGELLTLDFGCVLDGYCSDMTRTVGIGFLGEKEKEIYNIVSKAQSAALGAITAGKKCAEIDNVARDVISDAGYGKCFGHSLGHSLGIEIHESPNLSPRSEDTLCCGNVVTVEPGIYIEDFGGVRIEDVVAVTENGCINLTHSDKNLIIL